MTEDTLSILTIDKAEVAPVNPDSLRIYSVYTLPLDDHSGAVKFIPLSDDYSFYNENDYEKDTTIISSKYLETYTGELNYHELSPVQRKSFLDSLGIAETDSVYYYYRPFRRIEVKRVMELKLVAWASYYSDGIPYEAYDFMIGFEWSNGNVEGYELEVELVAVDVRNPFVVAGLERLYWEDVDTNWIPIDSLIVTSADTLHVDSVGFTRQAQVGPYRLMAHDYFVKQVFESSVSKTIYFHHVSTQLVAIDSKTESIVFDRSYRNSEGADLAPRFTPQEGESYMSAGYLFRDLPPVLIGWQDHSFGCESILVLDQSDNPIPVRCDNRH